MTSFPSIPLQPIPKSFSGGGGGGGAGSGGGPVLLGSGLIERGFHIDRSSCSPVRWTVPLGYHQARLRSPPPLIISFSVASPKGKADEDHVHVVDSEEHGWLFVGIYNGFNSPDATNYLLSHMYPTLHKELKGLLWDENPKPQELERSCLDSDRVVQEDINGHYVLEALSQALRKTEEAYLDTADKMLDENPELALMGSCDADER
ncbi:unnamed protein product [Eruca vesicaria subsp. sativa]|uniref:Protein-serine/threonine phosphatase n=1 Tax=Eruca vesicaria subsp. sativa TaxID=29727 RepID=A0ABC8JXG1_ERUVS|nr:unnamed protein product [Eruca vesicaria subsp. sativa]